MRRDTKIVIMVIILVHAFIMFCGVVLFKKHEHPATTIANLDEIQTFKHVNLPRVIADSVTVSAFTAGKVSNLVGYIRINYADLVTDDGVTVSVIVFDPPLIIYPGAKQTDAR